ncbi:MAG TPA: hypothetical protein VFJ43_10575 [Bacteroidia bacterium]|nr:hypothetical protein [Bacteroidia bacterium]
MKKLHTIIRTRISQICLSVLFVIFASQLTAQVSAYTFASTAGTYSQIIPGTDLTATAGTYDDNNFALATLPFTFTYHGTAFTTIGISANGYVALGATTSTNYTPLGGIANCISAMGVDMDGNTANGGDISYFTLGAAPNRSFIIQWKNWGFFSTALNEASFQIVLNETSNSVQIIYGNCPGTTARSVQTGLTGATTADFSDRTTTTNWAATTAGAVNTATNTFSSTVKPTSGLTFTWTSAATVAAMTFTSSAGTYTSYAAGSGGTTLSTPAGFYDDNNFAPLATIPFTFTYHGTAFTTFGVSANGYIRLGQATITSYTPLSNITDCISAFGNDL